MGNERDEVRFYELTIIERLLEPGKYRKYGQYR